jgi:hypothetical protein
MNDHSITKEQRDVLNQDLATIMQTLGDITFFLNACYGSGDSRVTRSEEAQAALQRLLWALERQGRSLGTGDVVGSTRLREIAETDAKVQQSFESASNTRTRSPHRTNAPTAKHRKRTNTKVEVSAT